MGIMEAGSRKYSGMFSGRMASHQLTTTLLWEGVGTTQVLHIKSQQTLGCLKAFSTKTNRNCANWNQSLSADIVNTVNDGLWWHRRPPALPGCSSPDHPLPLGMRASWFSEKFEKCWMFSGSNNPQLLSLVHNPSTEGLGLDSQPCLLMTSNETHCVLSPPQVYQIFASLSGYIDYAPFPSSKFKP